MDKNHQGQLNSEETFQLAMVYINDPFKIVIIYHTGT